MIAKSIKMDNFDERSQRTAAGVWVFTYQSDSYLHNNIKQM